MASSMQLSLAKNNNKMKPAECRLCRNYMRLHRFYIQESIGSQKEITVQSDELINQITRVFRLKIGDAVILFDGSGNDYECTIANFGGGAGRGTHDSAGEKTDQKMVTFNVAKSMSSRFMPVREISLCAAVVKKDTFEWIAEKATELGVTQIIPVMAERSEKKNLNEDRLKKIVIEASEQSGRGSVPTIHPIISLKESLDWIKEKNISALAFHTEGPQFDSKVMSDKSDKLEVFIGPEGGWSPAEVEMFHSYEVPVVCLGTQVLRAETAVVAALSLTML